MENIARNSEALMQILSPMPVRHRDGRPSAFDCDPIEMDRVLGLRTIGNRNLRIDAPQVKDRLLHTTTEDSPVFRRSQNDEISGEAPMVAMERKGERDERMLVKQLERKRMELAARSQAECVLSLVEQQQSLWIQYPAS